MKLELESTGTRAAEGVMKMPKNEDEAEGGRL